MYAQSAIQEANSKFKFTNINETKNFTEKL
jgi:hypothetical protein